MLCMCAPLVVLPSLSSLFSPHHPRQLEHLMFVARHSLRRVLLSSIPPIPVSGVLSCV